MVFRRIFLQYPSDFSFTAGKEICVCFPGRFSFLPVGILSLISIFSTLFKTPSPPGVKVNSCKTRRLFVCCCETIESFLTDHGTDEHFGFIRIKLLHCFTTLRGGGGEQSCLVVKSLTSCVRKGIEFDP